VKTILLVLFSALSVTCSAQVAGFATVPASADTTKYYYFTKQEVLGLTNGIKLLEAKVLVRDTLLALYRSQVNDLQSLVRLNDSIIVKQSQQIELYKVNELNYQKLAELNKPTFWQSPVLWGIVGGLVGAGLGIVVGVTIGTVK